MCPAYLSMTSVKNILVLDDDRLVHLLIDKLCAKAKLPWRIQHVFFLEEAFRQLSEKSFDLMISDVHLQHPDKVWKLISALPTAFKTPIVLMSSEATAAVYQTSTQFERVKELLEKPIQLSALMRIHKLYLNHESHE